MDVRQTVLDLLTEGHAPRAVAHRLGLSRRTVERWRRAAHIEVAPRRGRPPRRTESQLELAMVASKSDWRSLRSRAQAALRSGRTPEDIARELGVTRRVVEKWRKKAKLRPQEVARRAAEELERFRVRHERTHQELRDLRKGDKWQQLAIDFTYHTYDLLPESVWGCLLAGEEVGVEFRHPNVDAADRQTVLVLDDDQRRTMREPLAVREGCELDDDLSDSPRARRDRYGRQLREELYGV